MFQMHFDPLKLRYCRLCQLCFVVAGELLQESGKNTFLLRHGPHGHDSLVQMQNGGRSCWVTLGKSWAKIVVEVNFSPVEFGARFFKGRELFLEDRLLTVPVHTSVQVMQQVSSHAPPAEHQSLSATRTQSLTERLAPACSKCISTH